MHTVRGDILAAHILAVSVLVWCRIVQQYNDNHIFEQSISHDIDYCIFVPVLQANLSQSHRTVLLLRFNVQDAYKYLLWINCVSLAHFSLTTKGKNDFLDRKKSSSSTTTKKKSVRKDDANTESLRYRSLCSGHLCPYGIFSVWSVSYFFCIIVTKTSGNTRC